MTTEIAADFALMPDGWQPNVVIGIDANGNIESITRARPRQATRVPYLIPGMANVHCHSFQRAFAGLAETRQHDRDDFWTWREYMYKTAENLRLQDLKTIALKLYIDFVKAGYTRVAEFHYLHHQQGETDRSGYAPAIQLADAAREAGIGLTLLPVLYMSGGFGAVPLSKGQALFFHDVDSFVDLVRRLHERFVDDSRVTLGVAFHSLRAVSLPAIADVLGRLSFMPASFPKHIHVAEQTKEVDDCIRSLGKPPIDALFDALPVDDSWTLIHATHGRDGEYRKVADRRAVVALCPTTEANLGDGLFPLEGFLRMGGRVAIGSDSNVNVDPAAELRLLEYMNRLVARRRLIATSDQDRHTGMALWRMAARNGAAACSARSGVIEAGARADLLVLDDRAPQFSGRRPENILDTLIFGGTGPAIRDVMVAGTWVVRDGVHPLDEEASRAYAAILSRLFADGEA